MSDMANSAVAGEPRARRSWARLTSADVVLAEIGERGGGWGGDGGHDAAGGPRTRI